MAIKAMKLTVECYSGRKAGERPVRFFLDGREYRVEAVLDQWYDPEHISYKVRADDANLYILRRRPMDSGSSSRSGRPNRNAEPPRPISNYSARPYQMAYSTATFVPF
jgi:hypothetical protein